MSGTLGFESYPFGLSFRNKTGTKPVSSSRRSVPSCPWWAPPWRPRPGSPGIHRRFSPLRTMRCSCACSCASAHRFCRRLPAAAAPSRRRVGPTARLDIDSWCTARLHHLLQQVLQHFGSVTRLHHSYITLTPLLYAHSYTTLTPPLKEWVLKQERVKARDHAIKTGCK